MIRRGFTLAEALVSLTLSITILAMIGALMSRLSDSSRRAAQREAINQASQAVMNRLGNDCRSAIGWTTPAITSNAAGHVLDLFLPDYSKPRLVVTPSETVWNPLKAENRIRVQYKLQSDQLLRSLTPHALATESAVIAESVQSFTVQRNYQRIRLTLILKEPTGATQKLESDVLLLRQQCWGAP